MDSIRKVAVVGAGVMGQQIAMNAALNGFTVVSTDCWKPALDKMTAFKSAYLAGRVEKGRLTQEEANQVHSRLSIEQDFEKAVCDVDLVIEAAVEKYDVKFDIFQKLDSACPQHTILATNSSYICSSALVPATNRADKILNMHYFAPAIVMKLVEVVRNEKTSDETVEKVQEYITRIGKESVVLNKEIDGFIVNRMFDAFLFEAHKLADLGVASPSDIDKAIKYGLGHKMGPFEINDRSGLDLTYTILSERYRNTGDPKHLPGMALSKHCLAGEYGQKSGAGFYKYDENGKIIGPND